MLDRSTLATLRALPTGSEGSPLRRLIGLYLQHAPTLAEQIRAAYENEDVEILGRAAHQLASSSANLGALELADVCRQLEEHCLKGQWPEKLRGRFEQLYVASFTALEHESTLA